MTARLISWPREVGLAGFEWLDGPLAVSGGGGAGTKISGRQPQVIKSPFGWISFKATFTEMQDIPERRHRGLMFALHSGANAVRVKWKYGSTLTPTEAGVVGAFSSRPWSTGYSWSSGRNWAAALPEVKVYQNASEGDDEVVLDDPLWGHSLAFGDIFGFSTSHLAWYFVTETFGDGAYRIWPPLRRDVASGSRATLEPTAAFTLTPGTPLSIKRGPSLVEGATAQFDEVFDYDVREQFTSSPYKPKTLSAVVAQLFSGSEPGVFFDPSDLSSMYQDSAGTTPVTKNNDPVGLIIDKRLLGGRSVAKYMEDTEIAVPTQCPGNHASVGTAGFRPLYKTDGTYHWIEGDGSDDYLRATFTIAQSWGRISAIRLLTFVSSRHIFGGSAANAGILLTGTSPNISLNDGSTACTNGDAVVGTDVVPIERHNGASSRLGFGHGAYATGNSGTSVPGGVTIFNRSSAGAPVNARCYGVVMRQGTFSDPQINTLRKLLGAKAGLVL